MGTIYRVRSNDLQDYDASPNDPIALVSPPICTPWMRLPPPPSLRSPLRPFMPIPFSVLSKLLKVLLVRIMLTASLERCTNVLSVAIGKPVIAKLADVSSRGRAYVLVGKRLPSYLQCHRLTLVQFYVIL